MSLVGASYDSSDEETGQVVPVSASSALALTSSAVSSSYAGGGLEQGPANPYKPTNALKRKNVPTGHAEELFMSHATFKDQLRSFHRERNAYTAAVQKRRRQAKGDASVVEGNGAYRGPWARFEEDAMYEEVPEGEELASDEEWIEESIAPAGTVPVPKQATDYQEDKENKETTEFHGHQEFDYQGRTYMHVPQDLEVDLQKEPGSEKNFIPKKHIHTWESHTKAITSLRFFPNAGHLLLSSSADSKIKIWDVYHQRELLRTYSGHNKAVTDTSFNRAGTHFLSASYDRQMKLWDTEYGKCVSRFTTGKVPHVVRFNPSADMGHEFLAGMADKKIVQFDTRTGALVQEYDHHLGPVNTLTFVDEDRRFVTTSDDKSLRAWEYGIPVPIKFVAEPYMYSMVRASLHPSNKYIAFQSGDNQIVVYAAGDKFRQNRKKSYRGHNTAGYAIDVSVSPDGQFIASGDSGGFACFWDWKTCKMYHKFQAHNSALVCLQWHPQESSKVATAGLDGAIKYWD